MLEVQAEEAIRLAVSALVLYLSGRGAPIEDSPLDMASSTDGIVQNNPAESCNAHQPDSCPDSCVVCPPCPECSSISCQSEEFCSGLGIDRSWYENIKKTIGGKENPAICQRENCHGLDIKCGANSPDVCTDMYALGDKCLQYAECSVVDGDCQVKANSQFDACRSCVADCAEKYQSDATLMFECEGKCQ